MTIKWTWALYSTTLRHVPSSPLFATLSVDGCSSHGPRRVRDPPPWIQSWGWKMLKDGTWKVVERAENAAIDDVKKCPSFFGMFWWMKLDTWICKTRLECCSYFATQSFVSISHHSWIHTSDSSPCKNYVIVIIDDQISSSMCVFRTFNIQNKHKLSIKQLHHVTSCYIAVASCLISVAFWIGAENSNF